MCYKRHNSDHVDMDQNSINFSKAASRKQLSSKFRRFQKTTEKFAYYQLLQLDKNKIWSVFIYMKVCALFMAF